MGLLSTDQIAAIAPMAVLKSKGVSFYWASLFLGKHFTNRAARLYRLCRYLDDMVDESDSQQSSRESIVKVNENLALSFSNDVVIQDGLALIKECGLNKGDLTELIRGVNSDNELVRVQDQGALLRYCYQVAGTVGLMMCGVLDSKNPNAGKFATNLGIAMQLTNICRDIKTDALLNRIYIPADLIDHLDVPALIAPNEHDQIKVRGAVQAVLELASDHYQRGELGLAYLPIRARFAILIAARTYREIGIKLKRKNFDYWSHRIVVSKPEKWIVTIVALVAAVFCYNFWIPPKSSSQMTSSLEDPLVLNPSLRLADVTSDAH